MTEKSTTGHTTVTLDLGTRRLLAELALANNRSLSGQVRQLVQEATQAQQTSTTTTKDPREMRRAQR